MAKKRSRRGLFGQPLDERNEPETVRVVKLAVRLSRRCLRDYTHEKSPKKFTQPQLMACLIFKSFLGLTYRRTEELLWLMPAVREAIGLKSVPRFTTLQTFADDPRTLDVVDSILKQIGRAINKARPQDAAIDSTGLEVTSASAHFLSRAGRKRTKFVKLSIAVLCGGDGPVRAGRRLGAEPRHEAGLGALVEGAGDDHAAAPVGGQGLRQRGPARVVLERLGRAQHRPRRGEARRRHGERAAPRDGYRATRAIREAMGQ